MRRVQQGPALLAHLIEGLALRRAQAGEPGAVLGCGSRLDRFEACQRRASLFGVARAADAADAAAALLLRVASILLGSGAAAHPLPAAPSILPRGITGSSVSHPK